MKKLSFLLFLSICLLLNTMLSALQAPVRAQAELTPVIITLTDAGFLPVSVTVVVGQQVHWVNTTQAAQTLTFGEPVPVPDEVRVFLPLVLTGGGSVTIAQNAPADVVLAPGAEPYIHIFDEAGTYPFFLSDAPSKRGEVIVQRASGSTPTTTGTTTPGTPTTTGTATPTTTGTATPTTPVVARPRVFSTTPGEGATGLPRDGFVTLLLALADNKPIDAASLSTSTVRLSRLSDGASVLVTAALGVSGNLILVKPVANLDANTEYRLELSSDVRDVAGKGLEPFSMSFTTAALSGGVAAAVYFEQVALPTASGPNGKPFTTLAIGPDGKLYAGTRTGEILRYSINADGTLTTPQTITTLRTYTGGSAAKPRVLLGMAFDPASSPSSPVLWLSHGDGASNAADWSGKLSKLSGASLETVQDIIVNLPRSPGDRMNAGLVFRPGSPNLLYLVQGSNSELGGDSARPERLLNAAVLQLDLTKLPSSLPLSVKTSDGGSYNPRSSSAPLTIFASGVRDAFDLAWHSNGQLYTPSRAAASGNLTPAVPNSVPASCGSSQRMDGKSYTPPKLNAISVTEVLSDVLIRVDPTLNPSRLTHGYFGHPNPTRCEFVLNGGNPSANADPAEVAAYAVNTKADPYFRSFASDLGPGALPGGILEYQSDLFGGKLQGLLLMPRAGSDDIVALMPGADKQIAAITSGIAGFGGLDDPLDLVENYANGHIYVSEASLTQQKPKITLLRPLIASGAQAPRIQLDKQRLIFNDVAANTATSPAQTLTIRNIGGGPLTVSQLTLAGAGPGNFVAGGPALPLVIPPQGTASISVSLKASTVGLHLAALQLRSDDPNALLTTVELRGLGTRGTGGDREPLLQDVVDALDIPLDVGDDDPSSLRMPRYGLIGDEVALQRMQKAGDGPVIIEPVAVFGPARNGTTLRFGWYPPANPAGTQELFTVAAADSQTLNPTAIGATSFDPGSASFGLYSEWPYFDNRRVYTEDFLNSWDPELHHHVRAYPLKNSDGSTVLNTYLLATEEYTIGNDTQDVLVIVRNVKPASPPAACSGCDITVMNQTWFSGTLGPVPFPERLAFSLIKPQATAPKDKNLNGLPDDGPNAQSHDINTLRLGNPGSAPLTISALTLRGPWWFVGEPALPLVIAPGGAVNLTIRFVASSNGSDDPKAFRGGLHEGWLEIVSSDPETPTRTVELAGWWMPGTEVDEPSLIELVQLFGYTTQILYDGQRFGPQYTAVGEEILSPQWERVDPSKPVVVRYLAAYHGCCLDQGGVKLSNVNTTLKHDGADAQTILPNVPRRTGPAQREFTPSGKFSLQIDNYSSTRHLNGLPHGVRFWPARDRQGNLIPNTYLVAHDYVGSTDVPGEGSSVNYDYQDNVILLSNVKPASGGSQPGQVLDRIDAGKSSGSTVVNGVTWRSDAGLYSPKVPDENPGALEIAGTNADAVYRSYRGKVDGVGKTLIYKIPVSQPEVGVRLHFAEMYWGRPGGGTNAPAQRLFDIEIEGQLIVEDYDIYRAAGGPLTAVTETIDRVSVGSDGLLEIKFTAKKDNISINGIEILAAQ